MLFCWGCAGGCSWTEGCKSTSDGGLCQLEGYWEATEVFMKNFRSFYQNALAIAISKTSFSLFSAWTLVLQTATMKTFWNARQREEMDLAHNVQWGGWFGRSLWSTSAQWRIWEAACIELSAKLIMWKKIPLLTRFPLKKLLWKVRS